MVNLPPKERVLDVDLSLTNYSDTCKCIADMGLSGRGGYVCVCNVHTVIEAHNDLEYAKILNAASIATPDGMPLVWALRRKGHVKQSRVYGPDLLLAFAEYVASITDGKIKSYFYGGHESVAEELVQVLQKRFDGFECAGYESPPFRELTPEEDKETIERINSSGAHVLWVGLGAPKQEEWMAAHAESIKPVMIGVGAAFDFHAGRVSQAPSWMMKCGLEWLYRFIMEPRRLWRRYLFTNPHFMWHVLNGKV